MAGSDGAIWAAWPGKQNLQAMNIVNAENQRAGGGFQAMAAAPAKPSKAYLRTI